MVPTFAEVLQAEPNAIEKALASAGDLASAPAAERTSMILLIHAILPDVEKTPARMQRLIGAIGSWLVATPRPIRQVDDTLGQIIQVFDSHTASIAKILAAAKQLELPATITRRVEDTLDAMLRDREVSFRHWKPFGDDDTEEGRKEIKDGKGHDLDELIHELQSRLATTSPA